jgi:ribosomal protein L16 Arg81 hydroxylase
MANTATNVLRSLTGGLRLEDFNEQIREQRVAHFKAAFDPAQVDSVLTVARLERALHDHAEMTLNIDIFDGTDLRQIVDKARRPGQTNFDIVAERLQRGDTIRVRAIEKFDAQLGALLTALELELLGQCDGNVYLTPPGKGGFPPHFDTTDVFVVQCAGKKHWRIHDSYEGMTELPLPDAGWTPGRFEPNSPPREFELNRGDVLYLPRGVMHSAYCTDRESMHLTISLAPLTVADLLREVISSAAEADIDLRRRVTWRAAGDDSDAQRLADLTKERLLRLVAAADFGALVRRQRQKPGAPG